MSDIYIKHYGTKGMKWGVRKINSIGGKRSKRKKRSISSMSDKELEKRVNRMRLEQSYKSLKKEQNKKFAVDFTKNILISAGQKTASAYVAGWMGAGAAIIGKTVISMVKAAKS